MDLSKTAALIINFREMFFYGSNTHSEIIPSLAMTTRSEIHSRSHTVEIEVFTSVQAVSKMNPIQKPDGLNKTHVTRMELAYTDPRIRVSTIYDEFLKITQNSHLAIMKCNPMNTRLFFCTSHCPSTLCQTQYKQFC